MRYAFSKIAKAGLLVGTLDITAAFIYYYSKTGKNPLLILKYIASALLGKEAYAGGNEILLLGLFLHYLIAFSFTLFFFWLFPKIKAMAAHKWLTGILYGTFIWSVMNLIVVPSSRISSQPFNTINAVINLAILIICIGIPLSFMAARFHKEPEPLLAASAIV